MPRKRVMISRPAFAEMSLCPDSCVSRARRKRRHSATSAGSASSGAFQRGNVTCASTDTVTSRMEHSDAATDSTRHFQRMGERVSPIKLEPATFRPQPAHAGRQLSKGVSLNVVIDDGGVPGNTRRIRIKEQDCASRSSSHPGSRQRPTVCTAQAVSSSSVNIGG